eukprot:gnl/Hemi2/20239_TR6710_c0_g1_i1.p1 gnl/Hemi2/20239_TR6710_c0_g1~~gnl/Hemi2/20239_TR6710_c0_g1_i1.p1  ORF type:complete len:309 (+),score=112.11 gnl/Hemi2/20239_TR6710_c0_g1_i1:165-1091(+)
MVQSVFSPDGRFVLSGSEDGIGHIWSAAGGRGSTPHAEHSYTRLGYTAPLLSVDWHPTQHVVALSSLGPVAPIILFEYDPPADQLQSDDTRSVASFGGGSQHSGVERGGGAGGQAASSGLHAVKRERLIHEKLDPLIHHIDDTHLGRAARDDSKEEGTTHVYRVLNALRSSMAEIDARQNWKQTVTQLNQLKQQKQTAPDRKTLLSLMEVVRQREQTLLKKHTMLPQPASLLPVNVQADRKLQELLARPRAPAANVPLQAREALDRLAAAQARINRPLGTAAPSPLGENYLFSPAGADRGAGDAFSPQ